MQEFHDAFANVVTFTYEAAQTVVTQDLGNGQTRTVTYTPTITQPTSMTYGGRTWSFQWTALPLRLTQVQPPAGPAWSFNYTTQQTAECFGYVSGHV